MESKYAILLDGGFLIAKLEQRLLSFPTASDIVNECRRIRRHPALDGHQLLRVYFYHAPPAVDDVTNPLDKSVTALGKSQVYKDSKRLLDTLELEPDFALRLGDTFAVGWKLGSKALRTLAKAPRAIQPTDLVPDITQKGVDLRIGLDIARLSLGHLVDVVVDVTGDSDLVPAFKFARREGLRLYLDHLGHGVRRELKVHADLVL
jgi:uncharacterized LabA/DUF88 family protein